MSKHKLGGKHFERIAIDILEKKGFENIHRGAEVDYEAEKDGVGYAIEVKGTQGLRMTVPWSQLESLHNSCLSGKQSIMLFICDTTNKFGYCVLEVVDSKIEIPPKW